MSEATRTMSRSDIRNGGSASELDTLLDDLIDSHSQESGLSDQVHRGLVDQLKINLARMRQGQYEEAIKYLTVLAQAYQSPVAYLLLAESYMRIQEMEAAFMTLDVSDFLGNAAAETDLIRGLYLLNAGERDGARASITKAVQTKPWLIQGWRALINMAMEDGDRLHARDLVDEAIRHNPECRDLTALRHTLS